MKRLLPVYAACVYAFLYLPLLVLSVFSFNQGRTAAWTGWSLHWYRLLPQNEHLLESTLNSLTIACLATLVATVAGTLAAYAMWKRSAPLVASALYLSLVTPEIVTGVSLLVFFQFVFHVLPLHLGLGTVVLAHIAFSLVYVVSVVLARLRTFDRTLEEAARDLGATDWTVFRRVTLPLLWPGVVAAALLCFTVSFDDYVITSFVAGVDSETLPMAVYAMARKGVSPEVNALSVLLTVVLGVFILLASQLERRRSALA